MNRLVRRQRAALALFIALTVSGVGVAMATPQTGDQPTVVLNITSGGDGQNLPTPSNVTVAGNGFPASRNILVVEAATLPNNTTALSAPLATIQSSPTGTFQQTVTVSRTFTDAGSGQTIDCSATGVQCYVQAFTAEGDAQSQHTISFASGGTTAPPTTAPPTTAPPTTAPPTTAPPTTAPPTTLGPTTTLRTTTTLGPTTTLRTTTTIGGGPGTPVGAAQCAQIRVARAQLNAQVDAARASILRSGLSGSQLTAALAQLEAVRAQGNAQLDALLAGCPAP